MEYAKTKAAARAARRAGFTLVELLVVVGIIGILGTVAVISVPKMLENARVNACRENIHVIKIALDQYNQENGKYPSEDSWKEAITGGDEPILEGGTDKLMDPWAQEIQYKLISRTKIELRSAGPDGQFETEDDLTN